MSGKLVMGGRHSVPRQTQAAAPRVPAPVPWRARRGSAMPATLNMRTDGRNVRSSSRCHAGRSRASPLSSTVVGGIRVSSSAASSVEKPAGESRERRREQPHSALARFDIARLRRQMTERDQRARGDAVARRRRVVVARLRSVEESLVIVAREEEPAVLACPRTRSSSTSASARAHA